MKRLLLLVLLTSIFFISGCSVEPSKVDKDTANKMSSRITYFKDHRTDLCFAIIATRKTGRPSQSGMGMAEVPCDQVSHLLTNK